MADRSLRRRRQAPVITLHHDCVVSARLCVICLAKLISGKLGTNQGFTAFGRRLLSGKLHGNLLIDCYLLCMDIAIAPEGVNMDLSGAVSYLSDIVTVSLGQVTAEPCDLASKTMDNTTLPCTVKASRPSRP